LAPLPPVQIAKKIGVADPLDSCVELKAFFAAFKALPKMQVSYRNTVLLLRCYSPAWIWVIQSSVNPKYALIIYELGSMKFTTHTDLY
jgi:hypothetical protein